MARFRTDPPAIVAMLAAAAMAVFLIIALFTALFGGSESSSDNGSSRACIHFRNVIADLRDGVLTDEEARAKIREVDRASGTAAGPVQSAARAMLAALTRGDNDEFLDLALDMDTACRQAGT